MSEKSAYKTFRNAVPLGARLDRVENIVCAGMPDVNLCLDGVELWLEFKAPTEPRRASTPLFGSNHKILTTQINWFSRHIRAGGRGGFIISTDKRWIYTDGTHAAVLNDLPVSEILRIASWTSPRRNVSWNKLFNVLTQNSKQNLTLTNWTA